MTRSHESSTNDKEVIRKVRGSAPGFPTSLNRPWGILVAVLLGLAWLPVAHLGWQLGERLPASLFPADLSADALWWLRTSAGRLVLGLSFCLLVVPVLLSVRRRNYRTFLRASGVIGFRRNGALLTCLLVLSTLLLNGVYSVSSGSYQGSFAQMFDAFNPFTQSWLWLAGWQPPLFEELLFRGIIFGLLLKYAKPWLAILLSSLLFGVVHLFVGGMVNFVWSTVFALTLFASLRFATGSIWASVFMHFVNNEAAISPVPLAAATFLVLGVAFVLHRVHRRKLLRSTAFSTGELNISPHPNKSELSLR